MEIDKRVYKRFSPEGLIAHITIAPPAPYDTIIMDGVVVDMSYSGIKIKLDQPLEYDVTEGELRISIKLPESGVIVSIHGMIRHVQEQRQCGLQYSDQHTEDELDSLMFECIKYAEVVAEAP